ncbi:MAG: transposase [Elusimicrobia bacterium]|nr:transposase [Elusimicrobiota bacterium]
MSRRPRIHFQGAVYHALARGVNGGAIYIDDRDRREFLSDLKRIEEETGAEIVAYCLMGNHFHLAVRVGAIPLRVVMQRLLTGYVLRFNARHQRTGHLFQARHKAHLCLDEAYLYRLIRYIHLNPVRAGLVADPCDWPWSSVMSHPGNQADLTDFEPWPRAAKRSPALIRDEASRKQDIAALSLPIASREGVSIEAVRSCSKAPRVVAVRRLMALEAVKAGHSMTATARWLGLGVSSVSRYSRERIARSESLTP